jgi:hypothetical protein
VIRVSEAIEEATTPDGYVMRIYLDEVPENPREQYDHVCILTQLSDRYEQPDDGHDDRVMAAWRHRGPGWRQHSTELTERYARAYLDAIAVQWWDDPRSDSRVFGYVTSEALADFPPDSAESVLATELAEYAAWCEGEVFGYVVSSPDGENLDSCWGYYGNGELTYIRESMEAAVAAHRAERHAEAQERFRRMVGAYRSAVSAS